MKILQLTAHFAPNVGGVETHLGDLVGALVRKGSEVFVLTYRPLTTKTRWKMFEAGKGYQVLRIPWLPGFFYKLVGLPLLEFLYLLPGLFIAAPYAILLNNPDVIHAHGLVAGFVGGFWGKAFGKRVIISTHSIYHFPSGPGALRAGGLYANFARGIFKRADKVLTLSRQSAKEIESLGIDEKKIGVFTYWIDLEKFRSKVKGKRSKVKVGWEGKFVVLFVGRLVEEKGVNELLKAAKIWNKKITLAIAGSGPLKSTINHPTPSRLRGTGQPSTIDNLVFLGTIDNDKLPEYYNAADLVIVPSMHEEGFGRVILEGLACGTPVIGANRGAIPEAMDETVGKLIEVTPENIKKAVEYFYNNPDKLEKLSKKARKFAEKRYSERNVKTIINAYAHKD